LGKARSYLFRVLIVTTTAILNYRAKVFLVKIIGNKEDTKEEEV